MAKIPTLGTGNKLLEKFIPDRLLPAGLAARLTDTTTPEGSALTDRIETVIEETVPPIPPGVVTSDTISSVRTTYDPNEVALPGELLVTLRSQFFTDFSDMPLNEMPVGWAPRWRATGATWEVREESGTRLLYHTNATGAGRRGLAWEVGTVEDAEIVVAYRATPGWTRPVIRGRGVEGAETGYYGGIRSSSSAANGKYVEGTNTIPLGDSSGDTSFSDANIYVTRFRVEGSLVKSKTWLEGDPEPAGWVIEDTDSTITGPGWIGLVTYSGGASDEFRFYWVGIGLAGATAPTEAI